MPLTPGVAAETWLREDSSRLPMEGVPWAACVGHEGGLEARTGSSGEARRWIDDEVDFTGTGCLQIARMLREAGSADSSCGCGYVRLD